jgi:hypothetical protein
MSVLPAPVRDILRRIVARLRRAGVPLPTRALRQARMAWRMRELMTEAFDAAWYMRRYPDVGNQGLDPLGHYLAHGRREGRFPTLTHARAAAWVQSFGEQ